MRIKSAVLVYQAGIANVFSVDAMTLDVNARNARRLYQGDFHSAAMFARGLLAAGADVRTAACNMAGEIAGQRWNCDYDDQPFSDKFELVGGVI